MPCCYQAIAIGIVVDHVKLLYNREKYSRCKKFKCLKSLSFELARLQHSEFATRPLCGPNLNIPVYQEKELIMSNQIQAQEQAIRAEVQADLQAEIAMLRAENAKLKNKAKDGLKVSEKGALSVYGLGRFPVTLYKKQWDKLFDRIDEIKAFRLENDAKLAEKD